MSAIKCITNWIHWMTNSTDYIINQTGLPTELTGSPSSGGFERQDYTPEKLYYQPEKLALPLEVLKLACCFLCLLPLHCLFPALVAPILVQIYVRIVLMTATQLGHQRSFCSLNVVLRVTCEAQHL